MIKPFEQMSPDERAYDRTPRGRAIYAAIDKLDAAELEKLMHEDNYLTRDSQLVGAIRAYVRNGNSLGQVRVVEIAAEHAKGRGDARDMLETWRTHADDVASGHGPAAFERAKAVKRVMQEAAGSLPVPVGLH